MPEIEKQETSLTKRRKEISFFIDKKKITGEIVERVFVFYPVSAVGVYEDEGPVDNEKRKAAFNFLGGSIKSGEGIKKSFSQMRLLTGENCLIKINHPRCDKMKFDTVGHYLFSIFPFYNSSRLIIFHYNDDSR